MRSIVEVGVKDGRRLTQPADDRYRGGPERPFTRAELHEKFADCASLVLSPERTGKAIDLIESIDRIANIRELTAALS